MRAWFDALPTPVRVAAAVAGGALVLIGLLLLYDWIGTTFLDTGGTVR